MVENPNEESVNKLYEKIEERAKFGDEKYLKCWEFVVGSDKICIIYHAECYKSAANKKILNGQETL